MYKLPKKASDKFIEEHLNNQIDIIVTSKSGNFKEGMAYPICAEKSDSKEGSVEKNLETLNKLASEEVDYTKINMGNISETHNAKLSNTNNLLNSDITSKDINEVYDSSNKD